MGIVVIQGIPVRQAPPPPKGAPRNEADSLAQALWHSTRYCHVQVGLRRVVDSLHAQGTYGVFSKPTLSHGFWDHTTDYVARHGAAPQRSGGEFNFNLNLLLRLPSPRLSRRPSLFAGRWTRTLNWRTPLGGTFSACTRARRARAPCAWMGCWSTRG